MLFSKKKKTKEKGKWKKRNRELAKLFIFPLLRFIFFQIGSSSTSWNENNRSYSEKIFSSRIGNYKFVGTFSLLREWKVPRKSRNRSCNGNEIPGKGGGGIEREVGNGWKRFLGPHSSRIIEYLGDFVSIRWERVRPRECVPNEGRHILTALPGRKLD